MQLSLTLAAALVTLSSMCAQSTLVVPTGFDKTEGNSLRSIAGVVGSLRQQILIDESLILSMKGTRVSAIVFRRDGGIAQAMDGGISDIVVRLSTCRNSTHDPSTTMAQNTGQDSLLVFQGAITVPASPAMTTSVATWGASDVLRIPFSTTFPYAGGTLCVDIAGIPRSKMRLAWIGDSVITTTAGSVSSIGTSTTDLVAKVLPTGERLTASLPEDDLVIGGTMTPSAHTTPNAAAALLIGIGLLPTPVDLSFIAAPGSKLYIDPITSVSIQTGPYFVPSNPLLGAFSQIRIKIPNLTGMMGTLVTMQWVDFGSQLSTSNALVCQFAANRPSLEMSLVTGAHQNGQMPLTGAVDIGVGHVMRFEYQ